MYGGRWNSAGREVIYACTTYSGAILEKLVHANGRVPSHQVCVAFEVPDDMRVQGIEPADLVGWSLQDCAVSRRAGDAWLDAEQTAVLLVPSVVFPVDRNALINPAHLESRRISVAYVEPVSWDSRLFKPS